MMRISASKLAETQVRLTRQAHGKRKLRGRSWENSENPKIRCELVSSNAKAVCKCSENGNWVESIAAVVFVRANSEKKIGRL